jgi:uncharacterized protein (DUF983 family)
MSDHHQLLSPLSTGLRGRCPRCGQGRLLKFLDVRETCERCGLDLRAHDSGDGPAVLVILLLGALVVPMALYAEVRLEPPMWFHAVVWPPVILVLALVLLRLLKGVLVALQYRHRGLGQENEP